MNVKTIGIDLAKEVFQVHGIDEHGKRLFNKQLKRAKMLSFFANIPPCLIGMEACASAHSGARITPASADGPGPSISRSKPPRAAKYPIWLSTPPD